MEQGKSISCSYAEMYCVKCGAKQGYNGNDPLSAPSKCNKCGGRMTNKILEEMYKSLDEDIERMIKEGRFNK